MRSPRTDRACPLRQRPSAQGKRVSRMRRPIPWGMGTAMPNWRIACLSETANRKAELPGSDTAGAIFAAMPQRSACNGCMPMPHRPRVDRTRRVALPCFKFQVTPSQILTTERRTSMTPNRYASCIDACVKCALACHHCSAACLKEDDVSHMARCISLDMDCAAFCELTAAAMARESVNAKAFCQVCADVCDTCADECAQHKTDHCQACAEACRSCAHECRQMAA